MLNTIDLISDSEVKKLYCFESKLVIINELNPFFIFSPGKSLSVIVSAVLWHGFLLDKSLVFSLRNTYLDLSGVKGNKSYLKKLLKRLCVVGAIGMSVRQHFLNNRRKIYLDLLNRC